MMFYWIAVIFGFLGGFASAWWRSIRRVPKPYRNFRSYDFEYKNPLSRQQAIEVWDAVMKSLHRKNNDP